jgi:hypothetical protein
MNWLSGSVRVAAELAPTAWTFAAAEHRPDGAPRLLAAHAIGATGAALADDIRAFRRAAKLPMDVAVILWPFSGDHGVSPIDSRYANDVGVPNARVLRERVSRLVRAGGLVTGVWLPHECFAALAASRGVSTACVIIAHPGMTCIGVVTDGEVRARYLSSEVPPEHFDRESARLLARYQHIASLAPHVRELGGAERGVPVLVAGQLPALRAAMVPLVEELDHEIDVLDAEILAASSSTLEPDDIAGLQLAWTLASGPAEPKVSGG